MPTFRFDKALGIARGVKVFLNLESGVTRAGGGAAAAADNGKQGSKKSTRRGADERQGNHLKNKDREISRLKEELRAAKERAYSEGGASGEALSEAMRYEDRAENLRNARQHINRQKSKLKSKKWEIFQLKNELRAAKDRLESVSDERADELEAGSLPDFIVVGGMRCGTTTLYHLLTQHPFVGRSATKELHFFDNRFEEGVEWYRRCFPPPRQKDGKRTITGEATPKYLFHPAVPERAAEVVPQVKLIALLRNPVDRAYSNYQHQVKNGRETRTFEEAIEAALEFEESEEARLPGEEYEAPAEPRGGFERPNLAFLRRGVYVDQLQRWHEFFARDQLLVLKSEDFFQRTPEILERIFDFLDLPYWRPETKQGTSEVRNKSTYSRGMEPETRRRLEEYFEPHNRRLYEYLGVNFGW